MIRSRKLLLTILILIISIFSIYQTVQAQSPVVRAVIFYSPTCPHCEQVIEQLFPVLDRQYGNQLQIYGINTYTETGYTLFENYIEAFNVPDELQAVPTLVVGDTYLIGSGDIPSQFPGIIEEGLNNGGIDWPAIPGLLEAIESGGTDATDPESSESAAVVETQELTIKEKIAADLTGNILSIIGLAVMLAAVGYAGVSLTKEPNRPETAVPGWIIPVLSLIGMGVAGYLAYVEFNQVEAVCGPVGNCNTVQQSSYATLFGFLPVGVLGVLGYIAIIITWLLEMLELQQFKRLIKTLMWVITLSGTLFSIYLTFLEPFVIGASCMWCLTSAVIMTVLFLVSTKKLIDHDPKPAA